MMAESQNNRLEQNISILHQNEGRNWKKLSTDKILCWLKAAAAAAVEGSKFFISLPGESVREGWHERLRQGAVIRHSRHIKTKNFWGTQGRRTTIIIMVRV
jgi:hypothetical protein